MYGCYDGLNRVTKIATSSTCASPFATYTYDQTTAFGATVTNGIGRLTSEQFTSNATTGDYVFS